MAVNNPLLLINKDLRDGLLSDFEAVELKARTLLIPESLPDRYQFSEPDYILVALVSLMKQKNTMISFQMIYN